MIVGENVGEHSILGWRAESVLPVMTHWTALPMHVIRMLQEWAAELQGVRIPKKWTSDDGEKFVDGIYQFSEKISEFGELQRA